MLLVLPDSTSAQEIKKIEPNKDFVLLAGTTAQAQTQDNTSITLIKSTQRTCRFIFFVCQGGVADIVVNEKNNNRRIDAERNSKIQLESGVLIIKEVGQNKVQININKPTIKSISREVGNIGDIISLNVDGLTDKNIIIDFAPEGNLLYSRAVAPKIIDKNNLEFSIPDGIDPLCRSTNCKSEPLKVVKGNYVLSLRTINGQSSISNFFVINDPKKLEIKNSATLQRAIAGKEYNIELTAFGASEDIVWSISDGNLPDGLSLVQKPCDKAPCKYEAHITGEVDETLATQEYGFEIQAKTKTQTTKKRFSIEVLSAEEPFISIYRPADRLNLSPGSEIKIEWDSQDVENVYITLEKNNKVISVLADDIDNKGDFKWRVPKDTPTGDGYYIQIKSLDPKVNDKTSEIISISENPFRVTKINLLRSQYQPNMRPEALVIASEFDGSEIDDTKDFELEAKLFDFKNIDITNKILNDNGNLRYNKKDGGWPVELRRTIDNGIYLLKVYIKCNGGTCAERYGSNSQSILSKSFSVIGTQTPQITSLDKNNILPQESIKLKGYQLATPDSAVVIRSENNSILNGAYELAGILETKNLNDDFLEFNFPEIMKIVPRSRDINLNLLNDINNSPIEVESLAGNYIITFVSPKGISNSLSVKVESNKQLALITGYEKTLWTFPSLRRIEWLSTNPIGNKKSPARVSIYLDRSNCYFSFKCQSNDDRIILVRNTPNDGVYEWYGLAENNSIIPDGKYNIVITDSADPESFATSKEQIEISNSTLKSR